MSEPAQKCENYAIFKQNYTLQLFIALKMVYCCSLGLRGNLDFPDFLQNKFYNINYCSKMWKHSYFMQTVYHKTDNCFKKVDSCLFGLGGET